MAARNHGHCISCLPVSPPHSPARQAAYTLTYIEAVACTPRDLKHMHGRHGRKQACGKAPLRCHSWPRPRPVALTLQVTIGYTVVAATAMSYIARWICDATGVATGQCHDQLWLHALILSGVQVSTLAHTTARPGLPGAAAGGWAQMHATRNSTAGTTSIGVGSTR